MKLKIFNFQSHNQYKASTFILASCGLVLIAFFAKRCFFLEKSKNSLQIIKISREALIDILHELKYRFLSIIPILESIKNQEIDSELAILSEKNDEKYKYIQ